MRLLQLLACCLLLVGCAVTPEPPYVPFKTYYTQPPGEQKNWPQPIQLECIDGSGIFVYTNGAWWYSGPRQMETKGWVPVGGGWYPTPRQVWPEKAQKQKQKYPPYKLYGDLGLYF